MARKPTPKLTAAVFISLAITYACKGKTYTAKPSVDTSGGCSPWCGSHDGGYCYCPEIEATATVLCECGDIHKFDISYR